MRPKSIVLFERLLLCSVLVSVLILALKLGGGASGMSVRVEGAPEFIRKMPRWPLLLVFQIGLPALLWYLVVKRAMAIGKWILAAWTAISLGVLAYVLAKGTFQPGLLNGLGVMALALRTVAAWLLFRPDAAVWFTKKPAAEAV